MIATKPAEESVRLGESCPESDDSAAHAEFDAHRWSEFPRASGSQIAWALRHAGLEAQIGGPDHALLMRDGLAVGWAPLSETVHPAIIRALLRTLGITPEQFNDYLSEAADAGR